MYRLGNKSPPFVAEMKFSLRIGVVFFDGLFILVDINGCLKFKNKVVSLVLVLTETATMSLLSEFIFVSLLDEPDMVSVALLYH